MIHLTRLNHSELVLNDDLIEHIEATPDSVITMTTGQRFTVLEGPEQIVELVRSYRRSVFVPDQLRASPATRESSCVVPDRKESSDGRQE